jgi:Mn2+/Fe2+ NRAMP family transporter
MRPSGGGQPLRLGSLVPGMLLAATGVGAGDLATSALAGSATGVTLLWAVVLGCAMKLLLTEGIARHQLATGRSVLHAAFASVPRPLALLLAAYFAAWAFLVAAALTSANGVVLHAWAPLLGDPVHDKVAYGVAASLIGLWLTRRGRYRAFERAMGACTAVMAIAVVGSAVVLAPDWGAVGRGLCLPRVPPGPEAHAWTIALVGGIGGTVTLLCYGYWIGEHGRTGPGDLAACRIDLAAGYATTAMFGVGMVIVGSRLDFRGEGGGATLAVRLADQLGAALGPFGRTVFLAGALAAVFSSLLGVWHSVPLLFADALRARRPSGGGPPLPATPAYRLAQAALATVPLAGLAAGFARMQKAYAFVGSLFMPLLALALVVLLRQPALGSARVPAWYAGLLVAVMLFYGVELWHTIAG